MHIQFFWFKIIVYLTNKRIKSQIYGDKHINVVINAPTTFEILMLMYQSTMLSVCNNSHIQYVNSMQQEHRQRMQYTPFKRLSMILTIMH